MANIAYITDEKMLMFHRLNNHKKINFWRVSTKSFGNLGQGELVFFISKAKKDRHLSEKGILGFGCVKKFYCTDIKNMWKKFKELNGASSYEGFLELYNHYQNKKENIKLSSLFLERVTFFQNAIFLSDLGFKVSRHLESFVYLSDEMSVKLLSEAKKIGLDFWTNDENYVLDEEELKIFLLAAYRNTNPLKYSLNDNRSILKAIKKFEKENEGYYYFDKEKNSLYKIVNNEITLVFCAQHKKYYNELAGKIFLMRAFIDENYLYNYKLKVIIIGDERLEKILNEERI